MTAGGTFVKIGIFGGTFDPVHQGHLILAELARDQEGLDEVWFMPAARPPQKEGQHVTRFENRAEMLELAVAGHAAFRVEAIEAERDGPSFTADTLELLRARHPAHEFHLLLGGDSLADLHRWHDPLRILAQVGLVVMHRPGVPPLTAEEVASRLPGLPPGGLRLTFVEAPQIDIASRDLRRRLETGRSVRYLLPRAVEVYARDRKLYRG